MRHVVAAACAVMAMACGTFSTKARRSLNVTAEVLVATDRTASELYRDASHLALQVSHDAAEYHRRMAEYDELETVLRAAHIALLASQAGLDIYDSTSSRGDFFSSVACLSAALGDIVARLETITGDSYPALESALSLLGQYSGVCDEQFATN